MPKTTRSPRTSTKRAWIAQHNEMEDTTKALGAVTSSELGSTVTNAIGTGTSAANSFLPIPAFESQDGEEGLTRLPGRIVTGAPPVSSKVYKSAHDCSASQHFEGETSGWGRVSPEYRDYSLLGVRLEPSGVAGVSIRCGLVLTNTQRFEFHAELR